MPDPLKKVKTGDTFLPSARRENLVTDSVRAFLNGRPSGSAGEGRGGVSTAEAQLVSADGGVGVYSGRIIAFKTTLNPASDLTLSALVNSSITGAGPLICMCNKRELDSGSGSHALDPGNKPAIFTVTRTPMMTDENPPRSVWLFDGWQPNC